MIATGRSTRWADDRVQLLGLGKPESLADQFVAVDRSDTGPISFAGPPYKLPGQPVSPTRPAPFLGQHNADIYCKRLGYTKEELVKLYQTGII